MTKDEAIREIENYDIPSRTINGAQYVRLEFFNIYLKPFIKSRIFLINDESDE